MTTKTIRTRVAAAGGAAIAAAALMAAGTGAASAAPADSAIPEAGAYTVKIAAPVPLFPTIVAPIGELPASVSEDGVLTVAGHSGVLTPVSGDGARTVIAGVPVTVWPLPDDVAEGTAVLDIGGAANVGSLTRN